MNKITKNTQLANNMIFRAVHQACIRLIFLNSPGIMTLDLSHMGGSTHPMKRQAESFKKGKITNVI